MTNDSQDINLAESRQVSYFSRKKNSPRGLANSNITLVKLENGGYKNMKPHHERVVKLEELLEKYESIKESRD